ncbi:uncharacterized protein LOC131302293 [Rhododendron vialii]|uniref:uncharacterized protein LOC131302293 n=1 Tax=Rhododendron vialii TaxID=182163 RepID=UPI00265FF76D|nr:uncharacterized protein LOC131302293 [Rhododendron vialii]
MTTDLESSGADSSLRRHSNAMTPMDDDRHDVMEKGSVLPIPVDALATASPVSPSTVDVGPPLSPLLTKDITLSVDKNTKQENKKELPWLLDYGSHLVHLAVFGILGVLTRYGLENLFGPGVIGLTSDQSVLYLELAPNMVGSFLMGWLGVVFKGDISRVSDHLAVGLTTGYLGSLTTFSGWNQRMLDLSVQGKWAVVFGIPLGFILADYSIIYGIRTAKVFKGFLETSNVLPLSEPSSFKSNGKVDHFKRQCAVMFVLLLALGLVWGAGGAFVKREFGHGGSGVQLLLGCIVGPFGVWIRWLLARQLNGRGFGKSGRWKWLPFGTLIANVSAACLMAALATLQEAVKTKTCDTIATGIQFGLLGCLSTVSTFIAEVHLLRESNQPWRGDAYAIVTIGVSFGLGTLIYSVPVWTRRYN